MDFDLHEEWHGLIGNWYWVFSDIEYFASHLWQDQSAFLGVKAAVIRLCHSSDCLTCAVCQFEWKWAPWIISTTDTSTSVNFTSTSWQVWQVWGSVQSWITDTRQFYSLWYEARWRDRKCRGYATLPHPHTETDSAAGTLQQQTPNPSTPKCGPSYVGYSMQPKNIMH